MCDLRNKSERFIVKIQCRRHDRCSKIRESGMNFVDARVREERHDLATCPHATISLLVPVSCVLFLSFNSVLQRLMPQISFERTQL